MAEMAVLQQGGDTEASTWRHIVRGSSRGWPCPGLSAETRSSKK
jgi:hypothetical protein